MIASLLPSLRGVRTPLAAGYALLSTIVLSTWSELPEHEDASGLVRLGFDLVEDFGKAPVALGAMGLAYLLGSVIEDLLLWLSRKVRERFMIDHPVRHPLDRESNEDPRPPKLARRIQSRLGPLSLFGADALGLVAYGEADKLAYQLQEGPSEAPPTSLSPPGQFDVAPGYTKESDAVGFKLGHYLLADIQSRMLDPSLAMRAQAIAQRRESLLAEADFREVMAFIWPMCFGVLTVVFRGHWLPLLSLVGSLVLGICLFFQAASQRQTANDLLVAALQDDLVPVPLRYPLYD